MRQNKRLLLIPIAAITAAQLTTFITVQIPSQAYRMGDLNRWAEQTGSRWQRYRPGDLNRWAAGVGERWRQSLRPRVTVHVPTPYDEWGTN